ncbi:MAG: TonB-dependent receptor [Bacteroidota bacterium]
MKNKLLLFLCTFFAMGNWANAQTAALKGIVKLADQSEAIGAVVELSETDYRTVSEVDGSYQLNAVAPKNYTLRVSYLGTKTYESTVELKPGEVLELDVTLELEANLMDELMVTSKSVTREQEDQAIQIESIDVQAVSTRVRDLAQAIDQLSGVRVRTSGALGDRADISLNGLNGTAVRTYLDGLPVEFIFPSLNIGNIPMSNFQRIDVYKGVLPVDVGTDAMGGGINLISAFRPYNSVDARLGYGSFNTQRAAVNLNLALTEDIVFSINSSYAYSDNNYEMEAFIWEDRAVGPVERFHDAFELFFVTASLAIRNKPWADLLRISTSYTDFYKEIQHGGLVERLAYGEAAFDGNSQNIFVNYEKSFGEKLSLSSVFSLSNENLLFSDTTRNVFSWSGEIVSRGSSGGEFGGASLSDRDQPGIVNRTSLKYTPGQNDRLTLSNLFANQRITGRDEVIPEEIDVLTQTQTLRKNILGLEYRRTFLDQKLELSAAGKLYYYNLDGVDGRAFTPVQNDDITYGWYGTAKYNFSSNLFVRGSYEKAWRIPNFAQFFGDGANIIANINLSPESSDNYNLGVSYRPRSKSSNFRYGVEVNGFYRGQNDIIFLSPNIIQQYINAEEVRTIGVEGEVFVDFLDHFRVTGNVTRLSKTYESIDENKVNSQFLVGTTFPNTPDFFANARLEYRVTGLLGKDDRLSVYTQYRYVDEFNFINVGQVRNDENWVPVQNKIDAGFDYRLPSSTNLAINFNVNNVMDDQLFDNFKIPRPGRNYNVSIRYQIDNFKLFN